MTVWDLSRLRYTVRKITGQFDEQQLPDTSPAAGQVSVDNPPAVDDYLNDVFFDFPEFARSLVLKKFYIFNTLPNCGTYNIGQNIYQFQPPAYVDNYEVGWYQDPTQFYQAYPEFNFIDSNVATTDGVSQTFLFNIFNNANPPNQNNTPIQQNSVVIGVRPNSDILPSAQLETFRDQEYPVLLDQPLQMRFTNPGTLTGNLGGTGAIDYLTGDVVVSFTNIMPAGLNITAHFRPYVPSRPTGIMFFGQQLYMRPIPNDTYLVKLTAYMQPTVAVSDLSNAAQKPYFDGTLTDVLQYNEWWQCWSYAAALKIMIQEGDHDEYERNKMYFEEAKLLLQRRTLKQLSNQRMPTEYSQNINGGSFPNYPWPFY